MLFESNVGKSNNRLKTYLTFINCEGIGCMQRRKKTCHNSCSGGIVIAVNLNSVVFDEQSNLTQQATQSVDLPWGYGVMDSIWGFGSQDPGSTPGTPATFHKYEEEER